MFRSGKRGRGICVEGYVWLLWAMTGYDHWAIIGCYWLAMMDYSSPLVRLPG